MPHPPGGLNDGIPSISCPPAARSAQFRDVDIPSGPGYPPFREGKVDCESESGDLRPSAKWNFIGFWYRSARGLARIKSPIV
jgi:hypothetical protein